MRASCQFWRRRTPKSLPSPPNIPRHRRRTWNIASCDCDVTLLDSNPHRSCPLKKSTHKPFAPRVSLASLGQIDRLDSGLCSIRGAQEVIGLISSRRVVNKLILGHNELGDDGCIVLFKFLASNIGRKYRISEISLNANGIGARGLLAISEYLEDNTSLKELFLQNNVLTGDRVTFEAFTTAVNSSYLEILSLTTNRTLCDSFVETFLPALNAPRLQELHLSALGLTKASIPHITAYVSSPRCQLHTLKCNGNVFGVRGVNSIIRATRGNFSLLSVELYANGTANDTADHSDESDAGDVFVAPWRDSEKMLRNFLIRNAHLKRQTETEALQLLRYSRALLLHSIIEPSVSPAPTPTLSPCSDSCACIPALIPSRALQSPRQPLANQNRTGIFPFLELPTELQLYLLSFLAPSLSSAQRIRIYRYASSPATLPALLPCLPSSGFQPAVFNAGSGSRPGSSTSTFCVPDPSSLGFGGTGPAVWSIGGGGVGTGGGCASGKCMGSNNSVVCHREQERSQWLGVVGCTVYEPGP